ncbi:MAG: hypothetical protein JO023_16235 [Chloroflexi bacterium]|nr:hypothetical protein [Chloroflexota bacterium]
MTATGEATTLFVVADSGNAEVRQLGAYPLPPSLTLFTQSGLPGTSVNATAVNFAPGDMVQLQFNSVTVDTKQADNSGTAQLQFTVPNLADGQYSVAANGQRGSAIAGFTIGGTSASLWGGTTVAR